MSLQTVQYFYPYRYHLGLVCRDIDTKKTKPQLSKETLSSQHLSPKPLKLLADPRKWISSLVQFLSQGNTTQTVKHAHIHLLTDIFSFLIIFQQAFPSLLYSDSPGRWPLTQYRYSSDLIGNTDDNILDKNSALVPRALPSCSQVS